MNNIDKLKSVGFKVDETYQRSHIRFLNPQSNLVFYNERGTDKIRVTDNESISLRSSVKLSQIDFDRIIIERSK